MNHMINIWLDLTTQPMSLHPLQFGVTLLMYPCKAVIVIVLLDFITGVGHWVLDSYIHADTPILGRLYVDPDMPHHRYPREFISLSYLQSSWDLLLVGGLILLCAWALDRLTWEAWLFVALGANTTLFHKWMHRSRRENGPLISLLHDLRLLQTPRQHARHHSGAKNTHYCIITNFLNPVLDAISFWTMLERGIYRMSGVLPRSTKSAMSAGFASRTGR